MMQPVDAISFLQTATGGGWSYTDGGTIGGLVVVLVVLWRRYQDALQSKHTDALAAQKGLQDAAAVLKDVVKSIERLESGVNTELRELKGELYALREVGR